MYKYKTSPSSSLPETVVWINIASAVEKLLLILRPTRNVCCVVEVGRMEGIFLSSAR